MFRICNPFLIAVLSILAAWQTPADAADKLLRWHLRPEQVLRIRVEQLIHTETSGAKKPLNISIELLMEVTWSVTEVSADGTARLTHTLDRFSVSRTGDAPSIEYDSAADRRASGAARLIADSIAPLIGTKLLVTMTDRGEFTDVQFPSGVQPQPAQSKSSEWAAIFSPAGISKVWRQSAVVLPENPLDDGGQWSSDYTLNSPLGTLQQQNEYTYLGTEQHQGLQRDKIDVSTSLELVEPASEKSATKSTLQEQKCTGVLWFDSQAGRFVETQLKQSLTLERPYGKLRIRVRTDTTTKMTIEE